MLDVKQATSKNWEGRNSLSGRMTQNYTS